VLDFSANYGFTDSSGRFLGSIKRKGMRSILKANYEVYNSANQQILKIHEENAWIKVIDAIVGELPVIGMFTGYLFNPAYLVERMDGTVIMRLAKQPAFFEGKFQLSPKAQVTQEEETITLLACLMMTLLERRRG
jgi:hypothetical protein